VLSLIEKGFPRLVETGYIKTSEETPNYNCIAFTLGDLSRPWWPCLHPNLQHGDTHWPESVPSQATLEAFVQMYRSHGFEPCSGADPTAGETRIAIYVDPIEGLVEHAALQLPNGRWISKMSIHEDIVHTLEGLTGSPHFLAAGQILKCETQSCSVAIGELLKRYSVI
jgi:hypothetical protein